MRKALLFLLLTAFCAGVLAQYQDTVWTVRGLTPLNDSFHKWKPDVVLDARSSTINGSPVRIGGLRLGAEYRRVHRFGLGVYGATTQVGNENNGQAVSPGLDSARFNLNYASLYYERVLLLHPKWEWSAALHYGAGQVAVTYGDQTFESVELDDRISVRPVEWSTSGFYHVNWWISAGGGAGYRHVTQAPAEIRQAYQGWIYVVKLRIKFAKLVRSIWDQSVRDEY